jgi:ParB family transcriptional regulator, chromosome partitioning protein
MTMNNKKRALGRGLSALLENPETDITTKADSTENVVSKPVAGGIAEIEVSQIETNPFQPRTHFEEVALLELADSIRIHGIIQPITVRKMGYDKYQLISGERRFRASQIAGLVKVPAYVRIANDQAMLEMALLENIQREDLNAIEVALSYKRLIDECSMTQEQVSEKMSKQRSTVTNYLRLLKLPAEIQKGIVDKEISMGHARALISIEDKDKQIEIYRQVVENNLSVRQTEELVRGNAPKKETPAAKKEVKTNSDDEALSFEHQKIQNELKNIFHPKSEFKIRNGKGSIVIPFDSEVDLERIVQLLDLN